MTGNKKRKSKAISAERETDVDVAADDASPPRTEAAPPNANLLQYLDDNAKLHIEDVEPFHLSNTEPDKLEDWMHDFEHQLITRDVPKNKFTYALTQKLVGIHMPPEQLSGTFAEVRDRILRKYGPEDPWGSLLTRMYRYQPREIAPGDVITQLSRFEDLFRRAVTRQFADEKERVFMLEQVVPRLLTTKLRIGVPPQGLSLLPKLKRGERKPLTLEQHRTLLNFQQFKHNMDFPNLHTHVVMDYTKHPAAKTLERRLPANMEVPQLQVSALQTAPPTHASTPRERQQQQPPRKRRRRQGGGQQQRQAARWDGLCPLSQTKPHSSNLLAEKPAFAACEQKATTTTTATADQRPYRLRLQHRQRRLHSSRSR